jgi:undecaprenyl-diphosphatase
MTLFEGAILGILQGITEFLPVSSDGHLLLAKALLGRSVDGGHAFDVAIHLGTLLATITVFRRELGPLVRGIPRFVAGLRSPSAFRERWRTDPAARFLGYFAISAIPAGVAGILFEDRIAAMNDRPSVLGPLFTISGLWLAATAFVPAGHRKIGLKDAALLGLVQAAAILPAISRSGMTLGCGVFRRVERASLGTFAFLMSIPPVAGAVLLKSRELGGSSAPLWPTLAGVVAAWVSGVLALRLLMPIVLKGRLAWFGAYCVVLGALCFVRFGAGA